MKTIKIIIFILFSLLAVYACNNRQSKKVKDVTIAIENTTAEKPVIKEVVKIDEKSILKKTDKIEQKELTPCEKLVKEILTTSPRYKQLTKGLDKAVVKNGGQSFGISLEGSPNPRQDNAWGYSKTYDFTVYEMYADRQLNTVRFSFNPNDKQLYEYDAVKDQLKPIEFDRNLLLKYETACK